MNMYIVGGKNFTTLEHAAEESVSLNNLQHENLKGDFHEILTSYFSSKESIWFSYHNLNFFEYTVN
jgi:hypothetical protein